ncbi:MAG: hypothetical protein QOE70_2168 [Chthoniobacter sp.]|jgi:hypothetical protein|nr:hypothetical protein [Chthoniobacter sp.]
MNTRARKVMSLHWGILWILALLVLLNSPAWAQEQLSDAAKKQIADLLALKATFTPAEQKMSSNLVFASRQARGLNVGAAAGLIDTSKVAGGMIEVDIKARVSPALLGAIAAKAGTVRSASATADQVRASVPLAALDALAADPAVVSIREAEMYILNAGSLTSQAWISHRAKLVHKAGVTGAGVKVGVISDSATAARVTALMASGDLGPNTTVLAGQNGTGTDEGAAMMEIVQDIAPDAQVFFATALSTQAQFATNIAALATAGCSIIVDDISYFAEGAFQDGTVAKAVNTFVTGGGLYFSSAGNSGNVTDGTSGTWEGDYLDGGTVSGPVGTAEGGQGSFHNFGTAGSPVLFDTVTGLSGNGVFSLRWSDPLGGSSNDYDLFLVNSTGTAVRASSLTTQNGTQDPLEIFQFTSASLNDRLVIVLYSGAPRALRLDTHRGRLAVNTVGSTFGHNAAQNTICVAATYWLSAKARTRPFDGTNNPVETFSSDGPRKIFFDPNGTAITPGNFLFGTNGGTTLQKPDLTAADGVSCKTPGFLPFFGTSAAAPHAAAIAALIKSARPALTGPQIRQILIDTAQDNMAPGVDRDSGAGVLNAHAAVQAALALP